MTPLHIINAFATTLFTGNPAAVMPITAWPDDALLQAVAAQNNLAETAFILGAGAEWQLRWFTPTDEVPLCGHATLASSWVIFNRLGHTGDTITFHTRESGALHVRRAGGRMVMDFPGFGSAPDPRDLTAMLGATPAEVRLTDSGKLMAIFERADQVRTLKPDMAGIAALDSDGVAVTAPGDQGYDCVSRYFAPAKGIPEDPVTGGAHCAFTPYWCERLGKTEIRAFQASARGGELICRVVGERVELEGQCLPYAQGMSEVNL